MSGRRLLAFVLVCALLGPACGGSKSSPGGTSVPRATSGPYTVRCDTPQVVSGLQPEQSQFENGGFEEGTAPWCSLTTEVWGTPVEASTTQAHTGQSSAHLQLRSEDGGETRVYGAVTEVAPKEFPEVLSGDYYVEDWQQGSPKQYLQFVVIVWNAANSPLPELPNHQIRYLLAGVDTQPLQIANAQYIAIGAGAPQQGQWVHFERNLRQDFEQVWGQVPEGYDRIRILFEVRWDGRTEGDGPSSADVYYDDLYLGPAAGAP